MNLNIKGIDQCSRKQGCLYAGSYQNKTIPKWTRIGLVFQRQLSEPFQMELLGVPKWARLPSRHHIELFPCNIEFH